MTKPEVPKRSLKQKQNGAFSDLVIGCLHLDKKKKGSHLFEPGEEVS